MTDVTRCFPATFCPFPGCSLAFTKDGDVDTVKFLVHFPFGLTLRFPHDGLKMLDLDPEDPKIEIKLFPTAN